VIDLEDGCRVGEGSRSGWRAVVLENGVLRAVVLPERGAELVELTAVASGVNVLFEAPWGLDPPGSPPRAGSGGHAFLEHYAGGWQELFPNAGDPCVYDGAQIPFHGEVATIPWQSEVVAGDPDGVAVRFSVDCPATPFRLDRLVRLRAGSATVEIEETATNLSDRTAHAVWGHHCVLGPPLVAAGARLTAPVSTIVTIPELWEETARLEPGQESPWPHARLRAGGSVDLGIVPGPDAGSHDDVYLTGLHGGWVEVENAEFGLAFRLEFDASLFRWLISWQPYGGAKAPPLAGSYALGIEPWTNRLNLEQAVAAGEAFELPPSGSHSTRLTATLRQTREDG
jgi:galactose mutarotase-like enzyme